MHGAVRPMVFAVFTVSGVLVGMFGSFCVAIRRHLHVMSSMHRWPMSFGDAGQRKCQQQRKASGKKQRKGVLFYSDLTAHYPFGYSFPEQEGQAK